MGAERAFDKQPHDRGGLPRLAQPDPFPGELVGDGAFGAFRYRPAIPERRGKGVGQLGHRARRCVGHGDALGALRSFMVYGCKVVASGWSHPRVSAGVATNATVPTQASHAAQKSGLLPYRQSATIYLNGSLPA